MLSVMAMLAVMPMTASWMPVIAGGDEYRSRMANHVGWLIYDNGCLIYHLRVRVNHLWLLVNDLRLLVNHLRGIVRSADRDRTIDPGGHHAANMERDVALRQRGLAGCQAEAQKQSQTEGAGSEWAEKV